MKKWICVLLALLLVAGTVNAVAEDETGLVLTRTEMLLRVDYSAKINVQSAPGNLKEQGFTYESSDKSIATVSRAGEVYGRKIGDCTITVTSAKDPAVQAVLPVRVVKPVGKLTVTAERKKIHVGDQLPLQVEYKPDDATVKECTYESNRENIVTVDENGVVTGVSQGAATITATSKDKHTFTEFSVQVVQQATGLTLEAKSSFLGTGKTTRLKATVLPEDAGNKNVTYQSSDESIATVAKDGTVTGKAPGSVTITAVSEDDSSVTATTTLTVVRLATKVEILEQEPRMHVGDTLQLQWLVSPNDATQNAVMFTSANTKIATVDEAGLVTGVKAGETTITVETADGALRKAHVKVYVDQPAQGVHMENDEVRIAVGYHSRQKAILEPKDATNKHMTWTSADESIATVSGKDNVVTIKGHRWGDTIVTGVTEDGGYTTSITVHIGSYRFAIHADSVKIHNGKPSLKLSNVSNLNITQVRFMMRGFDTDGDPIVMCTQGNDATILRGAYDITLYPGGSTEHGKFTFYHHSDYAGMALLQFAITGITTDTGFVYNVRDSQINWIDAVNPLPQ